MPNRLPIAIDRAATRPYPLDVVATISPPAPIGEATTGEVPHPISQLGRVHALRRRAGAALLVHGRRRAVGLGQRRRARDRDPQASVRQDRRRAADRGLRGERRHRQRADRELLAVLAPPPRAAPAAALLPQRQGVRRHLRPPGRRASSPGGATGTRSTSRRRCPSSRSRSWPRRCSRATSRGRSRRSSASTAARNDAFTRRAVDPTWTPGSDPDFQAALAALDEFIFGMIAARQAETEPKDILGMLVHAVDREEAQLDDRAVRDESRRD